MDVGKVAIIECWLRLCQTFKNTLFLKDWLHTIFDIIPCWHQFGLQFVHFIRLPRCLSAGIWCLRQPETEAALPLGGLLPPALHQLILHHSPYVLRCTGGNGVHPSEPSELNSATPHCNTELTGERKDSQRSSKLLTFSKFTFFTPSTFTLCLKLFDLPYYT